MQRCYETYTEGNGSAQIMAIGTLAMCYNNINVFRGVVKIRRGEALQPLRSREQCCKTVHLNLRNGLEIVTQIMASLFIFDCRVDSQDNADQDHVRCVWSFLRLLKDSVCKGKDSTSIFLLSCVVHYSCRNLSIGICDRGWQSVSHACLHWLVASWS